MVPVGDWRSRCAYQSPRLVKSLPHDPVRYARHTWQLHHGHRRTSRSTKLSATAVTTPYEPSYDAQSFMFPGSMDSRRINILSSPRAIEHRSTSYLPPVSSISSRGSSLEMDRAERPSGGIPAALPHLYHPSHTSYGGHYDRDHEAIRSQQTTPDYNSPGGSTISPSPYPSSSPIGSYSQPHYYSHSASYANPGSRPQTSYSSRPASQGGETRSPFSPEVAGLSMEVFDQSRPGKRRRGNLPKQVTDLLRSWLNDHLHHPYPTEDE